MSRYFDLRDKLRRDPITVFIALTAVGVGLEVEGREQQRRDEKRAAREEQAIRLREAEVQRERDRRLRAAQRARFGAAGLALGAGGTPEVVGLQALADSILDQELVLAGVRQVGAAARRRSQALRTESLGAVIAGGLDIATIRTKTKKVE